MSARFAAACALASWVTRRVQPACPACRPVGCWVSRRRGSEALAEELRVEVVMLAEGRSDVTLPEIIAVAATRPLDQTSALASIECTAIEVRSRSGTAYAGVDGEALEMETPVDFRIHAGGPRLLVPPGNVEAAHERATGNVTLNRLWQIARGAAA